MEEAAGVQEAAEVEVEVPEEAEAAAVEEA